MLEFTAKEAKSFFFVDIKGRERIFAGVDRARANVLKQSGAIVRTIARRSIKPARRRRLSELDPISLKTYKIAEQKAIDGGYKVPKLPFAHSLPGEPPRSVTGYLKQFLYFAYDSNSKSVVIGPAKLNKAGNVPSVLEYGGISGKSVIKARPYMAPAEEKAEDYYMNLWKDSIK